MPARPEKPRRSPQPDVERARYVAFRVTAARPPTRPALIAAIRAAAQRLGPKAEAAKPWLTRFDGRRGILRCEHTGKEAAIAALRAVRDVDGLEVEVETVGTSGTIAGCVRKFLPDLEDPGESSHRGGRDRRDLEGPGEPQREPTGSRGRAESDRFRATARKA